jgi:hypothetical protein
VRFSTAVPSFEAPARPNIAFAATCSHSSATISKGSCWDWRKATSGDCICAGSPTVAAKLAFGEPSTRVR